MGYAAPGVPHHHACGIVGRMARERSGKLFVTADTHPAAAAAQLELLRAAGCARRAALARSMSRTVIALSRSELAARMRDADAQTVALRWVELHYGAELAERLRAFLEARAAVPRGDTSGN
jgi:hypothetical protein